MDVADASDNLVSIYRPANHLITAEHKSNSNLHVTACSTAT